MREREKCKGDPAEGDHPQKVRRAQVRAPPWVALAEGRDAAVRIDSARPVGVARVAVDAALLSLRQASAEKQLDHAANREVQPRHKLKPFELAVSAQRSAMGWGAARVILP